MGATARAAQAALADVPGALAAGARGWRFLFWAVLSSWLLWWPAAALGSRLPHAMANAAILAGTLCIALAALVLLWVRDSPAQRRSYWAGIVRARPLPALVCAALLMPAIALLAATADALAGGRGLHAGPVAAGGLGPYLYLKTFAFGMVLGPIWEEMGWRGYALAPLQARYGARGGALLLAVVHALWHLPLFFLVGSAQQKLGFLTPDFWRFMADVLVFDVLAAAFFTRLQGSTLAAIVLHAGFNLSAALWVLSPGAAWLREGLLAALAVLALLKAFPARYAPTPAISGSKGQ